LRPPVFWAVFPIGPTGFRTFFIFLCGLAILVLRIAQYHVGLRTSNSGLQTFLKYAATSQTLEAIVSYTLSAWLFSQIYLWSATEDLAWVSVQPGVGGRVRLNEKPIFFTVHFLVLGVVNGGLHIAHDDDRLRLNAARLRSADTPTPEPPRPWSSRLLNQAPLLAHRALVRTLAVLIFNIVFYHAVLRSLSWRIALAIFRPFYTMPKTNLAPTTHGGISFPLWVKCAYASFMLLFLWLAGNKIFSMFLVRPPLKNGNPLTSESKDPNGSLLNGLKSKKLPIKVSTAF
jgi:nucleoporin NDC1